MTLKTDLDAHMDTWDPSEEELGVPSEVPADADQANRMLRRLRRIEADRAEVSHLAQAELDRIGQWAADRDRPLREAAEWLERAIAGWARAVHQLDPRRKTLRLPYGEVAIRSPRPSIEAPTDADALDVLAAFRPAWVRTTRAPDKAAIKAGVIPGEVVSTRHRSDGTEEQVREAIIGDTDPETAEVIETPLPGVFFVQATEPSVAVKVEP